MPTPALNVADLPDDVEALKRLVLTHLARETHYEAELALLREALNLALIKRFGRSSEKLPPPEQLGLFNEAEALAGAANARRSRTICRASVSSTTCPSPRRPAPAAAP